MRRIKRVDDIRIQRLRAQLRAYGFPCHLCQRPIDYEAPHLHPLSFQMDHRWQVSLGGPAYDPDNVAAAHRVCNRQRSNKVDAITIATAASYGVVITAPTGRTGSTPTGCAPPGSHCARCNGTHHPRPGVDFETARRWW